MLVRTEDILQTFPARPLRPDERELVAEWLAHTHYSITSAPSSLPGLTPDEAAYISGLLALVASLPKGAPIAPPAPVPPTLARFAVHLGVPLAMSACTNPHDPAQRAVGAAAIGAGAGAAIGGAVGGWQGAGVGALVGGAAGAVTGVVTTPQPPPQRSYPPPPPPPGP